MDRGRVNAVTRTEWGARSGRGRENPGPKPLVVLHHSWRPHIDCGDGEATETGAMRGMESYHAQQGWGGIAYNWLVFQSGRIYEGRGWDRTGTHTAGQNSRSVGICLVIDGDEYVPTPAAMDAVRLIIANGVRGGHIAPDHELRGHRDFAKKSCPGKLVYPLLDELRMRGGRPVLRLGDRGAAVKRAQQALGIAADGIFGPATEAAIRAWQEAHGLDADGIIGAATWRLLLPTT